MPMLIFIYIYIYIGLNVSSEFVFFCDGPLDFK